jgi:hypothetical protein
MFSRAHLSVYLLFDTEIYEIKVVVGMVQKQSLNDDTDVEYEMVTL